MCKIELAPTVPILFTKTIYSNKLSKKVHARVKVGQPLLAFDQKKEKNTICLITQGGGGRKQLSLTLQP